MLRSLILLLLIAWLPVVAHAQQTREETLKEDRARVQGSFWIYNDLPKAFEEAKQTGKPILVVLRCIPCEECVKLDDELVDNDPRIQPLLEKFVCVRQVSTNGLDLSLFQYDTDQSFAVFMLNADKTIYGRFGTRSHRTEWLGDVSLEGMAKALQAALELHKNYPANKDSLAGKRGKPLEFASPEKYPSLKEKYREVWDHKQNAVRSCIHCHQIGDARRNYYRRSNKPIPARLLFPYPHPKVVGLKLDAEEMATVSEVFPNSPAEAAGFQPGDQIQSLNSQPLVSIADVQWVLDGVDPAGGEVTAKVQRGERTLPLTLKLSEGWRHKDNLSWRVSSWGLRRMTTGGLVLAALSDEDRKERGIPSDSMALLVTHVGQYNAHAAAKRAGFRKGDVILAFDGQSDLMRETDLLAYGVSACRPGERVTVKVLRRGRTLELTLPMQP